MSNGDRIQIRRDELFEPEVDRELAKMRARRGDRPPEPPPLSPMRRLLYSSLFYLPAAAFLGALLTWMMLEPEINDVSSVGGQVTLVNDDPFIYTGTRSITVEGKEFLLVSTTQLEGGTSGQSAFASVEEIAPGDTVEVIGIAIDGASNTLVALAVRPATPEKARERGVNVEGEGTWALILLFPLTAVMIALFLLLAEGISSRNWGRMIVRAFLGTLLAAVFSALALIPAGLLMQLANTVFKVDSLDVGFITVHDLSGSSFLFFAACRSMAWACVGAGLGLGMNMARSTRQQLRNSVLGGALGGALGGLFFDPIDRFVHAGSLFATDAATSRLVGLCAVGICIGLFVALVERLARVAWIKVRTGPLAGKAFVLYKTPTTIGSSSESDIYLFKDAEIDPEHAKLHRVGNHFEIEDCGSRVGTAVDNRVVRRRRLVSGDQITIGNTVLEFEERAKNTQTG